MVKRFEVYLVNLDETVSRDAKNTRPCVVLSPDEVNRHLGNVIIAPLSSNSLMYPTRVAVNFLNAHRTVVIDQMRAVDKERLVKKVGEIEGPARRDVLNRLAEMFAE